MKFRYIYCSTQIPKEYDKNCESSERIYKVDNNNNVITLWYKSKNKTKSEKYEYIQYSKVNKFKLLKSYQDKFDIVKEITEAEAFTEIL